jgi:hypothetical protein
MFQNNPQLLLKITPKILFKKARKFLFFEKIKQFLENCCQKTIETQNCCFSEVAPKISATSHPAK